MFGPEPGVAAGLQQAEGAAPAGPAGAFLQQLELLGWVDRTALGVLLVFFVIGLFKGLFWQVSRIVILVAAYAVAARFGATVAHWLARDLPAAEPAAGPSDTSAYLAYVLVFLAVLVVLSLLAMQLQKLVKRTGLGFFDRLGGGLFGIATGGCTVLFLLFVVNMFFRDSALCTAAETSHSLRLSRRAIDWLGTHVPDDLRSAIALAPLQAKVAAPVDPALGDPALAEPPVGDPAKAPGADPGAAPLPDVPPPTPAPDLPRRDPTHR